MNSHLILIVEMYMCVNLLSFKFQHTWQFFIYNKCKVIMKCEYDINDNYMKCIRNDITGNLLYIRQKKEKINGNINDPSIENDM